MKNRLWFVVGFATVVGLEVLIGRYVHDRFIRPYVGDVLAVVAVYLLARICLPRDDAWLPLWVFLFAAAVECMQGLGWANLPLVRDSRVLRIALGSTFDLADIVCYAVGCGLIALARCAIQKHDL
ncbi:MAG: DUF2809 domain-containing protein [Clostridia bacterium]|nr:DUF2809 domain-containing protein [Clostridia bacterium]